MADRLSPEDFALIVNKVINKVINRLGNKGITLSAATSHKPSKDYHTVPEIRKIAMDLLPEFREWVMSDSAATSHKPSKDYHTVPEIRKIAMDLLPEFREWVMSDTFELAVIRHFLIAYIDARPGDSVLFSNGGNSSSFCTRLESQVNNAVQSWGADSPFEKGEERAQYRFR